MAAAKSKLAKIIDADNYMSGEASDDHESQEYSVEDESDYDVDNVPVRDDKSKRDMSHHIGGNLGIQVGQLGADITNMALGSAGKKSFTLKSAQ